jgi:hypothetical protein
MLRYIIYTTEIDVPELIKRLYEEIVFKLDMPALMINDKRRIFIFKWEGTFCYF